MLEVGWLLSLSSYTMAISLLEFVYLCEVKSKSYDLLHVQRPSFELDWIGKSIAIIISEKVHLELNISCIVRLLILFHTNKCSFL